ncbi:MAG: DUF4962 domain-containing protein [Alphaproteobacteria bacterium]|nr:DUF4962 domain-containing protein [Alphaproteobacteria bacterium]
MPANFAVILAVLAALMLVPHGAIAGEEIPDAADPYLLLRGVDPARPIQDWLTPAEPTAVQPYPANGELLKQTPPVIRWPYDGNMVSWQVAVKLGDGGELDRMARKNWLFLDRELPPGRHAWRLCGWPKGDEATAWSEWRFFTVPHNAHPFVVPDFDALFQKAGKKARPRLIPTGKAGRHVLNAVHFGQRGEMFESLRRRLNNDFLGQALPGEPPMATYEVEDFYEKRRVGIAIGRIVYRAAAPARMAAFAWLGSKDRRYLKEAMRRARQLAAWDPRGSTGRRSQDSISREIALTLATVLDLTYDHWDEGERREIVAAIVTRTQDLFDHYIAGNTNQLVRMPYNSHGYRHSGAIAAISSLLAGESPMARQWFLGTLPVYLAMNNPWGGDDGGFANSLNYALWNISAHLRFGDILEPATGLAIRRSAWLQEVGQYLRYFAPPGTPDGVFGDGHEHNRKTNWRRLANIYAQRVDRPHYRRFANDWGKPPMMPSWIFAPVPETPGTTPTAAKILAPNVAHFPSIGWTAMHSDLADRQRTSVYFISSPYGSYNHSHAAQNSFVVHSKGRRLALSTGYYDFYGSDHHQQWTRQSKSKNTITYDGGKGQRINDMSARGRTTVFRQDDDMAVVVGDATKAYGNGMKKAIRTLAYLRPKSILVYDLLRADEPRRWEWNFHALSQIMDFGPNAAAIANGPASLCIEILAGPEMDFSMTDRFGADPDPKLGDYAAQWHGVFAARKPAVKAEILTLMTVDCAPSSIADLTPHPSGGYSLKLDGIDLLINASGVARSK